MNKSIAEEHVVAVLTANERTSQKKSTIKQIRREGNIPAVLYGPNKEAHSIWVDGTAFSAILRNMKTGHLPTTRFSLDLNGRKVEAVIKDIQYQITTYTVSHLDFVELTNDTPISIKVPILCTGVADCVGIKQNGFLRQVIRHVKVKCLPQHIPSGFAIDVRDLGVMQSRKLKDLVIPSEVTPLANMDEVVVVVAKRAS
jgi:large subunit ribosomal protein L25